MKKVLFFLLSFLFCFNVTLAHVEDVQFVGGTGGSKIVELNVQDNMVDTVGVIYDEKASLVYEISYTNFSNTKKKITDIKLPDTDILLTYDFSNIDLTRVVDVGETVKFQYSIKAEDDITNEQLDSLNEKAHAQLVFTSVIDNSIENPNTEDIIITLYVVLALSIGIFVFTKNRRVLYMFFGVLLISIGFIKSDYVLADEEELVSINTDVTYDFSNLAPSCANLDYEGDFCIDWKQYGNRDKINYLVMTDSKEMSDNYKIEDVDFVLQNKFDVSEQQNGDVVLGVYKASTTEESYLFLIGQDGGVVVPKDASYQFTSYDLANNKNDYDFHFVKYLDFSKFYSNKTTDMEYMLTGLGTQTNMEFYDLSGFETSNVTNMKGMFTGFGEGTKELNIDVSNFDTSNVTDMSRMFFEVGFESESIVLDLSNFDTSNVTTMASMFNSFGYFAKDIELDIYDFDTSKVTDMSYMFSKFGWDSLSATIDYFKDWDTSNVIDMSYMFGALVTGGRNAYRVIDVTGLDTQKVTNMSGMFFFNVGVKEIKGLEFFDTSNVINMMTMFSFVDVNELKVENWDVSNVTNMSGMFGSINDSSRNSINKMEFLDLSSWDVSNVEKCSRIFSGSSFDINLFELKLKNVDGIFSGYRGEKLDLSFMNFREYDSYVSLFEVIKVGNPYPAIFDLSGSDWNEEADTTDMFKNVGEATIYVKDEKAKAFIEKQAPNCTVLIKE